MEDFQKGLGLFEVIAKAKMIETSKRRIEKFEQKADEMAEANPQEPTQQIENPQMMGGKRRKRQKRSRKKR